MEKAGVIKRILLSFLIGFIGCEAVQKLNQRQFPKDFIFGVGTSSYQIEGAWNKSGECVDIQKDKIGKGTNIWDTFTHTFPSKIEDRSNGDVACDSYNKVPTDIKLLKNLGVQYYRFSVSWARILPTGYINKINPDGIVHYNRLIDGLLAAGIKPFVTIYHWDLPQTLQDIGGWPNPKLADYYVDFADVVFEKFGDRVKLWTTFNELKQICKGGYGDGNFAPALTSSGDLDYKCTATILKAHARAYDLYKKKYKLNQRGKVGFITDSFWFQPATNSSADKAAADRLYDFYTGIFLNPIFGSGDFPDVVKKFVGERSKLQGFPKSRLPVLSREDNKLIQGSADFLGLNFYTALMVEDAPPYPLKEVSWDTDAQINVFYDRSWPGSGSPWLKVVPWSLKLTLNDLKKRYGDITIMITENGVVDGGGFRLNDYNRANYLLTHLSSTLNAIYDYKVKVAGYFYWSFLDNFEWFAGYTQRFGLYHVDFTKSDRPRKARRSAGILSSLIKARRLPPTTIARGNLQNVRLN